MEQTLREIISAESFNGFKIGWADKWTQRDWSK